jgi:hypothetical protein
VTRSVGLLTNRSCLLGLFFALSALENKRIYGADVSNAFAEAPSPAQTFYMQVDRVFQHWWTAHLKRPPFRALQGHLKSPRLWERHVTAILEELDFVPTTHELIIYGGTIDGHSVLFLRQVDDFAMLSTTPPCTR